MTMTFDFKEMYAEIYADWGYENGFEFRPERTALVVIDMQPAFVDSRYGVTRAYDRMLNVSTEYFETRVRELVIPNHVKLLRHCRERGLKVVFVVTWSETEDLSDMPDYQRETIRRREAVVGEQVYRKWNDGMQVCPELVPETSELVIPKRAASAFASSTLDYVLRNAGIDAVILTGVNTNGCVFETAVVGKNMGYQFILAGDATACFAPVVQDMAEAWMARHFAMVRSTEEIIDLLNGSTKT